MNSPQPAVTINGKEHLFLPPCSIQQLLETLELTPRGIAIEVDGELVSREAFETFQLCDGAAVEIVTFVGGG